MYFPGIILKKYPHLAGGPKGLQSPPQELEVGGRRPPYILVIYMEILFLK